MIARRNFSILDDKYLSELTTDALCAAGDFSYSRFRDALDDALYIRALHASCSLRVSQRHPRHFVFLKNTGRVIGVPESAGKRRAAVSRKRDISRTTEYLSLSLFLRS